MSEPSKQPPIDKTSQLTASGSALLASGILFTTVMEAGNLLKAAGVLLILAAAAMFGAAIRLRKDEK